MRRNYPTLCPDIRISSGGRGADCLMAIRLRIEHGCDRHPDWQSGELARARTALDQSNGRIDKVTDEEILAAYKLIARTDGISPNQRARPLWPALSNARAQASSGGQPRDRNHDGTRTERS